MRSFARHKIFSKLFPSQSLSRFDYLAGGALFLLCWVSFWHSDIWVTGWDSLNYLFGKPLDFYENCHKVRPFSGAYPPTIYGLFALWLYPLKLFGLVTSAKSLPYFAAYWLKTLTTLAYLASGIVFYKITRYYSTNKDWGKYVTVLWLTTPLALFSEFIFSQYDIFYVLLALIGLLMFLQGRSLAASLCFGLAITFKYFPVFAFVPLLLLFEKQVTKLLISLLIFLLPTLLIHGLYGRSPAFLEGVVHFSVVGRVYLAFMEVGYGYQIYYLFALFTMVCCWTYLIQVSKERLPIIAAYVFLIGSTLPFLFIYWHPQWMICFAPAMVLTTVIDKRCNQFLLLDLLGMLFFIAFVSIAFHGNVDAALFRNSTFGLEFHNSYQMARLFNVFGEHSANMFLSAFWGYLVIQIILKFKPAMAAEPIEAHFPVDYSNARYRFYVGLMIFLLPVSYAIYKDHRSIVHSRTTLALRHEMPYTVSVEAKGGRHLNEGARIYENAPTPTNSSEMGPSGSGCRNL